MRSDLPTGTVTFLFTDVEGSTTLLDELGADVYAEALAEHRRLVRGACARHGGVEVDTQGDAFFFGFPTAQGALAAAAEITEALASGPIRVRVGLHTGAPLVTDEGYVGGDVHRAARIAAAGHGGQVLVSGSTATLLEAELRDLGEHRLKDISSPERIFQLGDGAYPPLRSLSRTNLPVPSTPFVGRERELQEVVALLSRKGGRVLTLTGPGGTGKTRLAAHAAAVAADAYPDGVWWVALAPMLEPSSVLPELAATLGVGNADSASLLEAVSARLCDQRTLVLLDNAEHLLPELGDTIGSLVRETHTAQFLVTSRERLQLGSETVFPVSELSAADALELFLARAQSVGVDVSASAEVEELCGRLERLPLALELAAARTVLFTPAQLLERLGQRLDLLRGGRDADPRQATLRATIDWSYGLLDESERRTLRALSVFVGGCTVEAAETVIGADVDTIQSLLDKSLLRRRTGRATERLWMLETVREYAAERLAEAGETNDVRETHAGWMLAEAERVAPFLNRSEQLRWLALLDDELGNIRAARTSAFQRADADLAFRLTRAVAWFMSWRGLSLEQTEALEAALALPGLQPEQRSRALIMILDFAPSATRWASAMGELERLADGITDPQIRGRVLEKRAFHGGVDFDTQLELFAQARELHERSGNPDEVARIVLNTAVLLLAHDRLTEAEATGKEALRLSRALGNRHKQAIALVNLADTAFMLGKAAETTAALREAITLFGAIGDEVALGSCLGLGARIAVRQDDLENAARLLGAWDEIHERTGAALDPYDVDIHGQLQLDVSHAADQQVDVLLQQGAGLGLPAALELANEILAAEDRRATSAQSA